jgi:hypothetical protein
MVDLAGYGRLGYAIRRRGRRTTSCRKARPVLILVTVALGP